MLVECTSALLVRHITWPNEKEFALWWWANLRKNKTLSSARRKFRQIQCISSFLLINARHYLQNHFFRNSVLNNTGGGQRCIRSTHEGRRTWQIIQRIKNCTKKFSKENRSIIGKELGPFIENFGATLSKSIVEIPLTWYELTMVRIRLRWLRALICSRHVVSDLRERDRARDQCF